MLAILKPNGAIFDESLLFPDIFLSLPLDCLNQENINPNLVNCY